MAKLKSENIRGFIVKFNKAPDGSVWAYGGYRKDTALDTDFIGNFPTKQEAITHIRNLLKDARVRREQKLKTKVCRWVTK